MPVLPNARHERFAQELAKGSSQTEAYLAAGYKGDKTAASRMSTNVNVQARVAELKEAIAERAEITQADVLRELGRIGFADIRRLFTPGGNLRAIDDLDDDTAASIASIEVVTRRVPGGDDADVEHVAKIKTWDKRAALVDIGKHLGMFKDKVELTGKDGGPIEMADMDLARLIAFQLTKAAK